MEIARRTRHARFRWFFFFFGGSSESSRSAHQLLAWRCVGYWPDSTTAVNLQTRHSPKSRRRRSQWISPPRLQHKWIKIKTFVVLTYSPVVRVYRGWSSRCCCRVCLPNRHGSAFSTSNNIVPHDHSKSTYSTANNRSKLWATNLLNKISIRCYDFYLVAGWLAG